MLGFRPITRASSLAAAAPAAAVVCLLAAGGCAGELPAPQPRADTPVRAVIGAIADGDRAAASGLLDWERRLAELLGETWTRASAEGRRALVAAARRRFERATDAHQDKRVGDGRLRLSARNAGPDVVWVRAGAPEVAGRSGFAWLFRVVRVDDTWRVVEREVVLESVTTDSDIAWTAAIDRLTATLGHAPSALELAAGMTDVE